MSNSWQVLCKYYGMEKAPKDRGRSWEIFRAYGIPLMHRGLYVIHFPEERNGEGRLVRSMRRFSEVIDDLELKELALRGIGLHRMGTKLL